MAGKKADISQLLEKMANNTLTFEDRILVEKLRQAAIKHEEESTRPKLSGSLYNPLDPHSVWKNPEFRAAYEAEVSGPLFMSRLMKAILAGMVILTIITITGLFYLTISTLKNNNYPAKAAPKHNFRVR